MRTKRLNTRALFAVILFAVVGTGSAQQAPLEFKGIPIGAGKARFLEVFPDATCDENYDSCRVVADAENCQYLAARGASDVAESCRRLVARELAFGPAPVWSYEVELHEGRIGKVTIFIPTDSFPETVIALTEKYGKPTSNYTGAVQNRFGASFSQRVVTWRRRDGEIFAGERSSTVDVAFVTMTAKWYASATEKERTKRAKASAKGL